jgi:uncharacterized NAD(P)/FAD-binding protein YdhS
MRSVAIVGGGFCGTVTAVNLARLAEVPLRVTVFNHGKPLGRGVAYSTQRGEHLLNVPARNMSALADLPDHFVDWLTTRPEYASVPQAALREQFIPRTIYGDYLQSLLAAYRHGPTERGNVRIDCVDAEVLDIVPSNGRVTVVASGGRSLQADKVVLATGNQPPADPEGFILEHKGYVRDPWSPWENNLPDCSKAVLLLGTGLTAVDVILSLDSLGWRGKIYAVSRNGLLPLAHFKAAAYPSFKGEDLDGLDLHAMEAVLGRHCEAMREQGLQPAALVDKLRPFTQRLWQGLSLADKQRFLREWKTIWNVLRHRAPLVVHDKVTAAIAEGRLKVVKGKARPVKSEGPLIRLAVDRGAGTERILEGGMLINCTGPREGYTKGGSTLLSNLLARGLVVADDLDMGIRVTPALTTLQRDGSQSRYLLALGCLLKGTLWETTAVPELRQQSYRVAQSVVADFLAPMLKALPASAAALQPTC